MILPALTEATSPFLRPIKYSLFPPLGPGHARRLPRHDDEVELQDEHVERLRPGRRAGPGGDPGLHHVGLPRLRSSPTTTGARGAYVVPGRPARDVAAGRGRRARRHDLPRPRRGHLARVPRPTSAPAQPAAALPLDGAHARRPAADPPRPDQAPPVPGAQLDRRLARLPARLRLLLQGGVLRGRQVASTPRPWTRRWPRSSGCPAATCTSWTTTCSATARFAAALFDGMRGMGRLWQAAGTVNRCCGRACWRRRSAGGLRSLFVGFETLNAANLREQRKYQNLDRDYGAAIRRLHDLGVMVNGSFVFGMDERRRRRVRPHGRVGGRRRASRPRPSTS